MRLANKVALVKALGLDPKTLVSATISLDNSSAVTVTAKFLLENDGEVEELFKAFELVENPDAQASLWGG